MKKDRHKKILDLIKENAISTQEELASALNQAGYNVTQTTVSRDIRELNLTKTTADGIPRYVVFQGDDSNLSKKYIRVLKDGFVNMNMAQNILVIKTVPGMAMAVCAALDAMHLYEIVGTIAGDDTIMCAIRTVEETHSLMKKIRKIVES